MLKDVIGVQSGNMKNKGYGYGRNSRVLHDHKKGVYTFLERSMTQFGLYGPQCVLRAICEVNESPLQDDGLLGEIINVLLATSYAGSSPSHMKKYLKAESIGRSQGACYNSYPKCPFSFFRVINDLGHT